MFPEREREKFIVFLNKDGICLNKNLYGIFSNQVKPKILCAFLNSSITAMNAELIGRLPGGGGGPLDLDVQMVALLPVIAFSKFPKLQASKKLEKAFDRLSQRPIDSIFKEIGANTPEEVSLDKVKSDRRELDRIVMGEILGLSEEEQLEVYRAVVDLVRSRLEKARSVERRVRRGDVAVEEIAADVLREFGGELRFPEGYIEGEECEEIYIPKEEGEPSLESSLEGIFVRFRTLKLRCETREEAKYIEIAVKSGRRRIKIPKDKDAVRRAVQSYLKTREAVRKKIAEYVGNRRSLIEKIENLVWKNVLRSALSGEA